MTDDDILEFPAAAIRSRRRFIDGALIEARLLGADTAELAWYSGVRAGSNWGALVTRAAVAALAALPLQAFAVLLAVALLVAGAPQLASVWLEHGLWLSVAIFGVIAVEWRGGSGSRSEISIS